MAELKAAELKTTTETKTAAAPATPATVQTTTVQKK
jgi:hypothetical protein